LTAGKLGRYGDIREETAFEVNTVASPAWLCTRLEGKVAQN